MFNANKGSEYKGTMWNGSDSQAEGLLTHCVGELALLTLSSQKGSSFMKSKGDPQGSQGV